MPQMTPIKSIEDIKADYLMDVAELDVDCYNNAWLALRACYGMSWGDARTLIVSWAQESRSEAVERYHNGA